MYRMREAWLMTRALTRSIVLALISIATAGIAVGTSSAVI